MPTPIERIKAAYKAFKSLSFPESGGANTPFTIFPTMQDWQHAITNTLPGSASEPSGDPTKSSLVMAGIRWLGNTLPEPPVEVMKPGTDDDEVIDNHPMSKLMLRPNPYTSGSTLWKAFAYSWIISGNVYLIKFRKFSRVVELWYEPHWTIRPRWLNDKQGLYITGSESQSDPAVFRNDKPNAFINYYEVDRSGEQVRIEVEDVIHFRDGIDPYNTRLGLSGIQTILREIYGDSAAAEYAGGLLAANGVPPFVLSIDDKVGQLTEEDIKGIKSRLMTQLNTRGAREPLVTQFARVEKMGMSAEEIDLRTSRYLSEERFAAVTGIPLEVLNLGAGNEHSTFNNVSEAEKTATRRYLVPLWWHRDEELTVQLLPEFDQDESHYVESDTSEVAALQEDENAKWERIGQAYQNQIIMRSEARTMLDLEAEEGDEVYLVRGGTETVTLEQEKELRENPDPVSPEGQQLALVPPQEQKLLKGAPPKVKALYSAQ